MRARTKTALHAAAWVSAGMLVVGVAAGTAEALSGQATSTAASASGSTAPRTAGATGALAAAAGPARPGQARPGGPARLLRRALHGEFTVRTKHGYQTLQIQRGKLTTVDTTAGTIVVTSPDGFSATYAVGSSTKIRLDRRPVALSALKSGDRVVVVAVQTANGLTARGIAANDRPPRPARPAPNGTTPNGTTPNGTAPNGTVPNGTAPGGTTPGEGTPSGSATGATAPTGFVAG